MHSQSFADIDGTPLTYDTDTEIAGRSQSPVSANCQDNINTTSISQPSTFTRGILYSYHSPTIPNTAHRQQILTGSHDNLDGIPFSQDDIDGLPYAQTENDECEQLNIHPQNTISTAPTPPTTLAPTSRIENFISYARLASDTLPSAASNNQNSINSISCYQLNLHRSIGPLDNLQSALSKLDTDSLICFLQEPPISPSSRIIGASNAMETILETDPLNIQNRPRAAILLSSPFFPNCTPLTQFTSRDIATIRLNTFTPAKDLILSSFYWDFTTTKLPDILIDLCQFAHTSSLPLIIAGDVNAHHISWGSTNTNKRGEMLMDLILKFNLSVFNDGSKTFHNILRSEVLDITFGNIQGTQLLSSWQASPIPSLSDHEIIQFDLDVSNSGLQSVSPSKSIRVNQHSQPRFLEALEDLLTSHSKVLSSICDTTSMLNDKVDLLNSLLHKASKISSTRPLVSRKALTRKIYSPWWCKNLKIFRNASRKAWNRFSRTRAHTDYQAYKKANNKYTKHISKYKQKSWMSYCSNLTDHKGVSRLLRSLHHKSSFPTSIKRPDGTFSSTQMETLNCLTDMGNSSSTPHPFSLTDNTNLTPTPIHHLPDSSHTTTNINTDPPHPSTHSSESICTDDILHLAFSELKKDKAPGPDNITNSLIILAWPLIKSIVKSIFIACLDLSHIPSLWQSSKGIFFNKPNKPRSLASSWRSISLSSSLLKLLEKTVHIYLQNSIAIDSSLSDQQLGFRKNRSTDEALHRVVSAIELAISRGQFALGCFIDIKSAFDSISFNSIIKSLHTKNVPLTVINWITSLLCNRKIIYSLRGTTLLKYMIKGTPQGGILSPLLWNIVIDTLLKSLQNFVRSDELAQGFADDLVTITLGPSLPSLISRMQLIVNHIKDWCDLNELQLSTDKTSLVLFTWKRKFTVDTPIVIDNIPIQFDKDVKYLGVILDHKLNWNKHINYISNKATKATMAASRTVGKNWGLSTITARWIYNAIVVPRVTYGSHLWGLNPNSSSIQKLNKIQNQASRMIIRCPRYTSRQTMEITSGIPSLSSHVNSRAVSTLFRLQTLERFKDVHNNRTSFKPHSQYFKEQTASISNTWDLTSPTPLPTPKFQTIKSDPTLMDRLKQSQVSFTNSYNLTCFTDGSKIDGKTGASSIIYRPYKREPDVELRWQLNETNSVFQAEALAIKETCKYIRSQNLHGTFISILTDSLSVVQALSATSSNSPLILETRNELDRLTKDNNISIFWIRGHYGIEGNERADALAKQATTTGLPTTVPPPSSILKTKLLNNSISSRIDHISTRQTSNPLNNILAHFASPTYLKFFHSLTRRNTRILTSFLDNRAPLKDFLFKIGLSSDPTCDFCESSNQTNEHILNSCPSISLQRSIHLGSFTLSAGSPPPSPINLLNFLLAIALYKTFSDKPSFD